MLQHSPVPPSSAAVRMMCPGSRAMTKDLPEVESESAREGTAAHWLADWFIQRNTTGPVPACSKEGEPFTDEMIRGARLWRSYIEKVGDECVVQLDIQSEARIDIPGVHPDMWGTADAYILAADGHIHVFDYKFGFKYVEVFENWQLLCYAIGLAQAPGTPRPGHFKVSLHIVQPRWYKGETQTSRWDLTSDDLWVYAKRLRASELLASQPYAKCIPNPQCLFCKARASCGPLQEAALSVISISREGVSRSLEAAEAANELRLLEHADRLLDARIDGLKVQVQSEIDAGKSVPHYEITRVKSRQKWTVPSEEVRALASLSGIDLSTPGIKTPKQALDAGVDPAIVAMLSGMPLGEKKLQLKDMASAGKAGYE